MVADQIAAADHRIAELREFRDRLVAALTRLRDLPPKNGPCDPSCAFLHDRAPDPDLRPRLPLDDVTQHVEQDERSGSHP